MRQTLKPEALSRLTATWRRCREHYPGWVIAPAHARETLITYTDQWLDLLPEQLPRLPPADALQLLAEAIWRLEIALVPLTIDQAEMAERVLARVNPAPRILSWPADAELVASAAEQPQLMHAWILTAFASMREAREDLDLARFGLWRARLHDVVRDTPEWLARWHYEQALIAVWRLDSANLEQALNDWPVQLSQLPFWEVKRAALWGELGDIRRAEIIAESALDTIRQRTTPGSVDYRSLSEEGWAMRLVMALRASRSPFSERAETGRFQDRFAELSRYKCNPWETSEWFELALKREPPELRPEETESRTFDPGTYSTHYASQESPFKVARPAFGFLRMLEEAGVPVKLGRLAMLSAELKQIPRWIAPFAFLWSVSVAIRADEEAIVEQLLNRANIGSLKQTQAESLADWLIDVCERSIKLLTRPPAEGWSRAVPERTIGAVTEALSRLMLRVEASKTDRVVALAEQICRITDRRPIFGAMKHVDAIFKRAIEWGLTTEQLGKRLAVWLDLPLPSEVGAPDMDAYDRAEPFHHIRIREGMEWHRPPDSAIADRVTKLLRAVVDGARFDRERAALRLIVAARLHGLTASETRRLKQALWSRRDPTTRLPVETAIRLTALLRYSPLPKNQWHADVKHAFLEVPFPLVHVPSDDGKGVTIDQRSAMRRITDLEDVTSGLLAPEDARGFLINWTPGESSMLLARIEEWWQAEKLPATSSPFGKVFGHDPVRRCIDELTDFIGSALALTLPVSDSRRVMSLLESFAAAGIDVLAAQPATLRFGADVERVEREVLNHLTSAIPAAVRLACRAIRHWLLLGRTFKWAEVPEPVIDAVVWKIGFRRRPELDTTMSLLASLLRKRGVSLTSQQIDRLLLTLDVLLSETELPTDPALPLLTRGEYENVPYADRPHYQLAAARLARALELFLRRAKRNVPHVVQNWRDRSQTSPLPELRQVWSEIDVVSD